MEHVNRCRRTTSWILMVTFSVVISLQAASMGKVASEKDENFLSSRSDEMGQFEKDKPNEIKKKKKFPWLLVVAGAAVVVTAVYFLAFDKKKEEKVGTYTEITVGFNVLFQGNNQKSHYKVLVDGQTKIDETFIFDVHYSSSYGAWKKIDRSFWVKKRDLGDMLIRVEAGDDYEKIFPEESATFVAPVFKLEILAYQYAGGIDPGKPVLSEDDFWLAVSPGGNDVSGRIKEKTITISAPPIIQETSVTKNNNCSSIKYIIKEG